MTKPRFHAEIKLYVVCLWFIRYYM